MLLAAVCSCWAESRLPGRYVYPEWYLPYGYSACYPFASCTAYRQYQQLERRRERERELGRPPDGPPSGVQTWSGWQGEAHRRVPPGDPANATPEYEEAGRVRPEFEDSGEFLPEFLDGRARP